MLLNKSFFLIISTETNIVLQRREVMLGESITVQSIINLQIPHFCYNMF